MNKPKHDDKINKENELAADQLAAQQIEEQKQAAESARLEAEQASKSQGMKKDEEEEEIKKVRPIDIKHWQAHGKEVVEEYQKKFPDRKIDNDGTLLFTSEAEMREFFTTQAQANRKFLVAEVDANRQQTGHFEFSCGDGQLYSGSAQEIHAQLQQKLESALGNDKQLIQEGLTVFEKALNLKPEPTRAAKDMLKEIKSTSALKSSETPEPINTAPNPLSTTPVPKG